jgi:Protein of unknown function (DUF3224)
MKNLTCLAGKNLPALLEVRARAARAGFVLMAALVLGAAAFSQTGASANQEKQAGGVSIRAAGTFEVKLTPQKPDNPESERANISRMSADKQYHGDLEATSLGEMLSVGDPRGSAGYVAMERVTGKLKGRTGSFVLQHSGTMTRGVPQLAITVVPDSGIGELTGLSGTMNIRIENGKHSYEFEYTLPEKP